MKVETNIDQKTVVRLFTVCLLMAGLIVLAVACKPKPQVLMPPPEIKPKAALSVVLDSMLKEVGTQDSVHEIYVHAEENENSYSLLIYIGNRSLADGEKPVANARVRNVKFEVFSGIEHYFSSTYDTAMVHLHPNKTRGQIVPGHYWRIGYLDTPYTPYIIQKCKPFRPYTDPWPFRAGNFERGAWMYQPTADALAKGRRGYKNGILKPPSQVNPKHIKYHFIP